MMRLVLCGILSMGYIGCHAKPERVARNYLEALSAGDVRKARDMVLPACHEAPEGMGTVLSREGFEVRHAMVDVFVDSGDEQTTLVSYEVRGTLHSLNSAPSYEIAAQNGQETAPGAFRRTGVLQLEKGRDGWKIGCVR